MPTRPPAIFASLFHRRPRTVATVPTFAPHESPQIEASSTMGRAGCEAVLDIPAAVTGKSANGRLAHRRGQFHVLEADIANLTLINCQP